MSPENLILLIVGLAAYIGAVRLAIIGRLRDRKNTASSTIKTEDSNCKKRIAQANLYLLMAADFFLIVAGVITFWYLCKCQHECYLKLAHYFFFFALGCLALLHILSWAYLILKPCKPKQTAENKKQTWIRKFLNLFNFRK